MYVCVYACLVSTYVCVFSLTVCTYVFCLQWISSLPPVQVHAMWDVWMADRTCMHDSLRALNSMKPLPDYLLSKFLPFVWPIFDYCDAVWVVTSTAVSTSSESLHPRFLQGMSVCSSFIGFTQMERRRFHTAVQVFKVLHSLCPAYLRDWFVYAEAYTGRCRRNKHLHIPQI